MRIPVLVLTLAVASSGTVLAQRACAPPMATLGAPLPAISVQIQQPAPLITGTVQPPPDTPPLPFLGARYSFQSARTPCQSFNSYAPGYIAPQFYNPRYPQAGPYYYTRTYPYGQSYYNYYYTPGYFRY